MQRALFWVIGAGIFLVVLVLALGGFRGDGKKTSEKTYEVKGTITAIDNAKRAVVLQHEDIPGLMRAMEMAFWIEDPSKLTGLKVGDHVHGKLVVRDGRYILLDIWKHQH